jgi:HAD superfamily hydrolase (TIGR01509 family)
MKKLKLLLVDFDGVMSNGRFYAAPADDESALGAQAVGHIFTADNATLLNDWMRGSISYRQLHKQVAAQVGLDANALDQLLEASVKRMPLNTRMLDYIATLRKRGVTVSLFTNNMDIFDTVSRAHHQLDNHFDHIYSSSEQGQLKLEDEALLRKALREAGVSKAQTAFVDDSSASYEAATSYGIQTFLYDDYDASQKSFEIWLAKEFVF